MDAELSVKSWRILTFWEHDQHIRITHETLWPSPALLGRFLKNGTHEHQFFISLLNGNLYYSFFGVLGYLDSVTSQRGVNGLRKVANAEGQLEARVTAMRVWAGTGIGKGEASDHIFWTNRLLGLCFICIAWSTEYGQKDWLCVREDILGGKLRLFE